MRAALFAALALAVLAAACGDDEGTSPAGTPTEAPVSSTAIPSVDRAAAICAAVPEVAGNVQSSELIEISGIAASRQNEGVLWAHNDSGDTARVFAMGPDGTHIASFTLAGAEAVDWEDMAIGPGPDEGVDYLYLADIGDNRKQRPEVIVYRVPEPTVTFLGTPVTQELAEAERLTLRYPDEAHDAETLLVDPMTGDLVIVTKELAGGPSFVYRAPRSTAPGAPTTLEEVATINFAGLDSQVEIPSDAPPIPRGAPHLPTGGDVSGDGSLVIIRTYGSVWIWTRPAGAPLWEIARGLPCEAPSTIEPQGEAIAFDSDGNGYVTVSEGENPPLNHFAGN